MNEKRWLTLVLLLFLAQGFTYALVTPVFEASDELWHYPMIRHLADGNPLPVQVFDPAQAGSWKQEASQPPLYYYLGAALTFWIDTADMPQIRHENPHVDNGLITEDGNNNLVVYTPDADPWQGTLLAVRIVRLFSVLLATGTVYLTYRIAKECVPDRSEIVLGATAVNAFLPMFLFISGAVNNDNLAILLASLSVFLMIRAVTKKISWRNYGYWLLLGVVIGLALLTKEGTFGLLPLAWGTGFVVAWQTSRDAATPQFSKTLRWLLRLLAQSALVLIIILLPALLIAGWWYYRNIVLYGDWLGWNAFIAVLGQRAHAASLLQLWGERRGFLMSFWGLFGGVNIPMPLWIYTIFNGLLIISVIGFAFYFLREIYSWWRRANWRPFNMRQLIDNILEFVTHWFGLVVCLLFTTAVIVGLIQWATTTWSSQGRLVFTALSAIALLFVVGLVGWLPRRLARPAVFVLIVFMLSIAVLAPFNWIKPSYEVAAFTPPRPYVLKPATAVFGEKLRLLGVSAEGMQHDTSTLKPGEPLWIHLEWEVLQPMSRDWSVFVHLNDPVLGQPIAQRDMYLGQGLLLTSWLQPGERLTNSYKLTVPETAVAPADLDVVVGLYDFYNEERLPTESGDAAVVAKLLLQPLEGSYPNPQAVNFEDELMLVGYEIEPRRTTAGETMALTLYWEALRPLPTDYTFFAQIVAEDTTRWASNDLTPAEGTTNWSPGEANILEMSLLLSPDTPPGLYPLIIGVYTQTTEGDFDRLQIMTEDDRLTDDFLSLTPVRVD